MKAVYLPTNPVLFDIYPASVDTTLRLPLVEGGISAGFPSPADDLLDLAIDLNRELIRNPSATFYARVRGDSMKDVGIEDGDLLVIDRSCEPADRKIAVCFVDGNFTVKRIRMEKKRCWLLAENAEYDPIEITEENQFVVWGVVLHVIKSY